MELRKLTRLRSKCLAAVFAVLAVISLIMIPGINAHAYEGTSGSIGDVDYSFNASTGMLTITVTEGHGNYKEIVVGDHYNYYDTEKKDFPWNSFRKDIKSVVINGNVTHIGANAFKDCSNLKSITVPDSVKYILYNAFEASGLTSFKVPKKLVGIYNETFKDCTSLKSVNFEGYNPDNTDCWIGYDAFNGCTSLESIKIPRQILNINSSAFTGCVKLENLEFEEKKAGENGALWIDEHVFEGCTSLNRLDLPGHVEVIDYETFKGCTSLEYVNIKDSNWALIIKDSAFKGCNAIKNMYLPKRFKNFSVPFGEDNENTVFHIYAPSKIYNFLKEKGFDYEFQNGGRCGVTDETALKWYYDSEAKELVIEGNGAMRDFPGMDAPWNTVAKNAEKITVNAGCVSIGENAFYNLSKVKDVSIGNTVKTIGKGAFEGDTALTTVGFSNSLVSIGEEAFSGCSALAKVSIPNSVSSIGDKAFFNCSTLKEIAIPDSVTEIGKDIVKNSNKDLVIKTADGSVAADYAKANGFKSNAKTSAEVKAEEAKKNSSGNNDKSQNSGNNDSSKTSEKAPAKGDKISDKNFNYKVTKPGTSDGKTVGEVTLTGAKNKNIKKASIGKTVKISGITYKVTAIANKAFKGKKKLASVTIGANVKSIGASAFDGCGKLKVITIKGKKLKKVGKNAFKGTNKKLIIKVPKAQKKAYKKILKGKGQKKTAKIK